jgi:hypothetical protein
VSNADTERAKTLTWESAGTEEPSDRVPLADNRRRQPGPQPAEHGSRNVTDNDRPKYTVQRRYTLTNGSQLIQVVGGINEPFTMGELMHGFMEPLARDLAGEWSDDPQFAPPGVPGFLAFHDHRGEQVVLPVSSILFATIVQINKAGDWIKAEPGWPAGFGDNENDEDDEDDEDPAEVARKARARAAAHIARRRAARAPKEET